MEILKLENVELTYQTIEKETKALENINFSVEENEFVAIIGPSGCGKTTVLSLISGLISPSNGKVYIDSKEVSGMSHDVGYMLQRDQLFEWRNIMSNITLGLEVKGTKTNDNIKYAEELIKKYGLGEFMYHMPNQLSGGMRQRAALIRTLAFKPKILLLDEPFSALDYQTRLSVCDDVHKIIKEEKKTAVLVTHDISEAISLADKIIVLSSRPATVKNIHILDNLHGTPLQKRESANFSKWFDKIYKEIIV